VASSRADKNERHVTEGKRQRVGIREVAEAADVSVTTVSDVLNGKGRVTESTRKRVREVAEQLGYRPLRSARQLRAGETGIVAIFVSSAEPGLLRFVEYDYFRRLIDGAASEALARGKWPVLIPSTTDPDSLAEFQFDGAVVIDPAVDDHNLAALQRLGVPTVTSGRSVTDSHQGPWVDNDLGAGTEKVLDHLYEQGASRIALINAPPVQSYALDAQHAYEEWCSRHGMPARLVTVRASLDEEAGYAAARNLLTGSGRPDGVFAILDRVALGVLMAARAAKIKIPRDLLLAATTNSARSQTLRPALTVLELHQEDVGRLAVETLLDLISGRIGPDTHRVVPVSLVVRATSRRR
jgi:DNA-binding LacI/PurR family transcriptional regulator